MKIILTEQEMINIVSTLNEEDIKNYCGGKYTKWIGEKNYLDMYEFEYKFDEMGNIKKEVLK